MTNCNFPKPETKDKPLFKIPTVINATTEEPKSDIVYMAKSPQYQLDTDVILSALTKNELEESLAKIKFHKIIYDNWGFGEVDKLGRSSILNFYGYLGTGKTLTAEAFTGRLGLPIIKVGIAEIEKDFQKHSAGF
ncbi:MAG: hypothetical protein Q3971_09820 [Moraxella sp.]|nr:hypothetical protein [Moraxella sp.]